MSVFQYDYKTNCNPIPPHEQGLMTVTAEKFLHVTDTIPHHLEGVCFDETGENLRRIGHEFGATTGRPRRCGWLDLVALKYAVMMNGVTDLIMMKSDVMNDFDTIKVATAYKVGEKTCDYLPYGAGDDIEPVYTEFPGWKEDICGVREYAAFPQAFKNYVKFIEEQTGCPVKIISVGPDRSEVVVR